MLALSSYEVAPRSDSEDSEDEEEEEVGCKSPSQLLFNIKQLLIIKLCYRKKKRNLNLQALQ